MGASELLGDYFRSSAMIRVQQSDFRTYLRAVEHFFGFAPQGNTIYVNSTVETNRPRISKDEELKLAWCLIADQHELLHYHQFVSTSVGLYKHVIELLYGDFLKKIVCELSSRMASLGYDPKSPIITSFREVVGSDREQIRALDGFNGGLKIWKKYLGIFDDDKLSAIDAVNGWNRFSDFFNGLEKNHSDDDIVFPRVGTADGGNIPSNPPDITLTALFESSARLLDVGLLRHLRLSSEVEKQLLSRLSAGKDYYILIRLVQQAVEPGLVLPVLGNLVGIALQSPLSSYHYDSMNAREDPKWEDLAPTWRCFKILEEIKQGSISPVALASDPKYPDQVCDHFGWPRISDQMRWFVSKPQYRGDDPVLSFVIDQHSTFCRRSIDSPLNPVWMLQVPAPSWGEELYPPFHIAAGSLVGHKTLTDDPTLLDMFQSLIVETACSELLFENKPLATNQLIECLFIYIMQHEGDQAAKTFLKETLPALFWKRLGMPTKAYVELILTNK